MLIQDDLKEFFTFDSKTGTLYRKKGADDRKPKKILAHSVEKTDDGYVRHRTYYKKKHWPTSHIILCLASGLIVPEGKVVDHIDGDSTNNRLENLRIVSGNENARNNKRFRSHKTPGVAFHTRHNVFRAYIKIDGQQIHLGSFKQESDAILRRNEVLFKVQQTWTGW